MSNRQDEEIRIYFSDGFSANEVAEITDSFNKILPTHGISNARIARDSADATSIVQTAFLVIIVFAGSEMVKGFFNSIGSDLKEKLIQVLKNKKEPLAQFKICYKNFSIEINAKPERWEEWNTIFETIGKAEQTVINEAKKDSRVSGIIITYDTSVNGYWSITKS